MTAKPFAKWAGGKGKLLTEILWRLPEKIKTYYEPFVGGGAVFFALAAEKRFARAVLSDVNEELIVTYNAISLDAGSVIEKLQAHAREHSESYFYHVRGQKPSRLSLFSRAARFIYLNRTCFNGLYRVNKKGEFNVPFGKYTNPTICDEVNLRAVSEVLSSVTVAAVDFEVVCRAKSGDAVYFDPPYAPLSATSNFTAYAKGGFDDSEQTRLRDCFRELDKRGVHVLLSNSDTPLVRELYKGFKIEEVQAPRRVNSKGDKRGNVGELLISGKNSR